MTDKLTEVGRYNGMQMNVEETKVMRISRQSSPVQIMIEQKQLQNMEHFKYFGSMIANDARCTGEIKSRISTENSSIQEEDSFHQQTGLEEKQETSEVLHLDHSFVWCWRMEKIS
jgi:hypothetical protein